MMRSRLAPEPRRGIVLLGVLVIVVLLSLAAYQYSELMSAEYAAMTSYAKSTKTRALAESGVHYGAALLADPFAIAGQLGNNPYDNPTAFRDVVVQDDGPEGRRGMFSIISIPRPDDLVQSNGQQYRYGVTDENAKLNLNALLQYDDEGEIGFNMLMQLPNMTEDIANAILDWLDPDDTVRAGGAENETYGTMSPAYRCKNGPLDSLEELLLVKGVQPWMLFGNDRNRNGVLDPEEQAGAVGGLDLGWQAYLTVFSVERNLDSTGEARIYLNDTNQFALSGSLDEAFAENPEAATFIMAYRMYGGKSLPDGQEMPATPAQEDLDAVQAKVLIDFNLKKGKKRISTPWDLLYKTVEVTVTAGMTSKKVVLPSPFADPDKAVTLLPILFDRFTTRKSADLTPRINVSTASSVVLGMLKDITPEEVAQIMAAQPVYSDANQPDSVYFTPAWLFTEAQMDPKRLKKLDKYITSTSQVYRFQVVGYQDVAGPISRAEAVVDGNMGRPRIVYWRDLTELGPGFPLGGNVPVP